MYEAEGGGGGEEGGPISHPARRHSLFPIPLAGRWFVNRRENTQLLINEADYHRPSNVSIKMSFEFNADKYSFFFSSFINNKSTRGWIRSLLDWIVGRIKWRVVGWFFSSLVLHALSRDPFFSVRLRFASMDLRYLASLIINASLSYILTGFPGSINLELFIRSFKKKEFAH